MRRIAIGALLVTALAVSTVPAEAQGVRSRRQIGFAGFAQVDRQTFTAKDTFDAIMRDTRGTFPGGGGQFRWRQLVFEVSGSQYKRTGERVFVVNREVFRLGIPTTVTMTPVEVVVAYRLPRLWRVVPYGGGGAVRQSHKETSKFAAAAEDVKDSHTGYLVVGGGEVNIWRWFSVAVEARYRSLADAIGQGGVAKEFGEDDLGGSAIRIKFIVGR
jgi:opacity protein-like surface antigen